MELDENIINSSSNEKFALNFMSVENLNSIRKWTMFFSISGFVMFLFTFVLGGILYSTKVIPEARDIPFGAVIIIYTIISIAFVPSIWSLFSFTRNMKFAIKLKDSLILEKSFDSLKFHFKYVGIITSIVVVFFLLCFVIVLIAT